jgi:MoaA/NifB/PqqE/SkfB family radical SAM enzyme
MSKANLKTFCAYGFSHINIRPDGRTSLCCRAQENIAVNGRDLSLHHETFQEIWNSTYMRDARRRMIYGEPVAACAGCYRTEQEGGKSLRDHANSWENIASIFGTENLDEVYGVGEEIVSENGGLAPPPSSLHFWLGNLCNLKCRMCNAEFSSQIAADAIHSRWNGELVRKIALLPNFLKGVAYEGFGTLETRGDVVCRIIPPGEMVRISLPQSGDPVGRLHLSGFSDENGQCRLVMTLGNQLMKDLAIDSPRWNVEIALPLPVHFPDLITIGLKFEGIQSQIGVQNLTLHTSPPLGKGQPREIVSRFPENPAWFDNEDVILKEIMTAPERLRWISFAGGEPMLSRRIETLLSTLVERGVPDRTSLFFSTNGTQKSPKLFELLKRFRWVGMAFSFDGIGPLQEYIRPPSNWGQISGNILRYREEGIAVEVHPTPQAYNVFGLLELIEFCDRMELKIVLNNVLYWPRYLSFDMLPGEIIAEALGEWRNYRETRCRPDRIRDVDTVISALSRPRPADINELQEMFIRFTNDLDKSRGQSLKIANPRLYRRLVDEGLVFEGKYSDI